jgi:hypothetical protein
MKRNNAHIYFDALKEIGGYMKPAKLRKDAERMYGLEYLEVLEMAYENVLTIAQKATYRHRRPGAVPVTPEPPAPDR